MKYKTKTSEEVKRSSQTKLIQRIGDTSIYSHTIKSMAGSFVVVRPEGWETYQTFQDAKRAVVLD